VNKIIDLGPYFHIQEGLTLHLEERDIMVFNAIENKVIIKIAQVEETTESGLYIPDTATAMPETGVVVSVGPGRIAMDGSIIPTGIKAGDKVIFERRAAQKVELDEEEYLVFLTDHILAIVEE